MSLDWIRMCCNQHHTESNTCGLDGLICAETSCPYGQFHEPPTPRGASSWFMFEGQRVQLMDDRGNINWKLAFAME